MPSALEGGCLRRASRLSSSSGVRLRKFARTKRGTAAHGSESRPRIPLAAILPSHLSASRRETRAGGAVGRAAGGWHDRRPACPPPASLRFTLPSLKGLATLRLLRRASRALWRAASPFIISLEARPRSAAPRPQSSRAGPGPFAWRDPLARCVSYGCRPPIPSPVASRLSPLLAQTPRIKRAMSVLSALLPVKHAAENLGTHTTLCPQGPFQHGTANLYPAAFYSLPKLHHWTIVPRYRTPVL
jgi:hypothetical protein